MIKAIALFSGGLDSSLAIKVILQENVDVEAVTFLMPFYKPEYKYNVKRIADKLKLKLKVLDISNDYIKMLGAPIYGYGKNLNPCIDCKIMMYKQAKNYMNKTGASFVISGDVIGQRPMSQYKQALKIIEKESELEGLILRPLSAKLLPVSIPEKKGWVNREKLLDINGRSRKPQMILAKSYNINDYFSPAGGCLLTDSGFARRVKDLMKYSKITLGDIELLRIGKHFRVSDKAKLVVGRNKDENDKLLKLIQEGDICFSPLEIKGPIGLGKGDFDKETILLSSQIIARYSDGASEEKVKILMDNYLSGIKNSIVIDSINNELLSRFRI